jgi:diguanylate cyclase
MALAFNKKKPTTLAVEELNRRIKQIDAKKDLFLRAVRALFQFLIDFSLDIKEIDAEGFRQRIDHLSDRFATEEKNKTLRSQFEKNAPRIETFIKKQKRYILDRETELKDIIELLSQAMVTVNTENQQYNQKIFKQSEKLEHITLLDDIRRIKGELAEQIQQMRQTIQTKQLNDEKQLAVLSRQVQVLDKELKKARVESTQDGLTGAYNRKAFDHYLREMVERNTIKKKSMALLFVDIDDFKKINDSYGHQTGDSVLVAMTRKCAELIRSNDFLARYGGEEFVIVLPGASLRNATKRAKKICKTIGTTRYVLDSLNKGPALNLTVSIGVSALRDGDTVASLCERADQALYLAKNTGKNRVVSEKEVKLA